MKDMKVLEDLKETVLRDLKPVADKNSLTPTEVSVAKDAVCLLKEINEVLGGEMNPMETSEAGRSMRSMSGHSYGYYDPYMRESYSYGYNDFMDPYSYSMMRGRDARTGRFMSRDGMDTSGRRYTFSYDSDGYSGCYDSYGSYGDRMNSGRGSERSRDSGRSGHSIDDRVVDMLEHMMDSAASEYERHKLNSYIRVIDSMRGE